MEITSSTRKPLIEMIHVLAISFFKNRILLEFNNKKPWKIGGVIQQARAIRNTEETSNEPLSLLIVKVPQYWGSLYIHYPLILYGKR